MSIDNPRGSAVKGVKGLLVWGARSISVSTLPRFLYPGYEALTASAEDVGDFLRQFVDLGVEQFILVFPYGHEADSVKLMAERVLPTLNPS